MTTKAQAETTEVAGTEKTAGTKPEQAQKSGEHKLFCCALLTAKRPLPYNQPGSKG